ncbi:MAG: nitronate monooxygenase, partial [Desulfomonile tiedjei]|nr:nitronate monooxygenase [Desulfomonile tiedjei]
MKLLADLKVPVLYVNPPLNADSGLIEKVSRSGGLGIVDHVTSGPSTFKVSPGIAHGVRVLVQDIERFSSEPGVAAALIALEDVDSLSSLDSGALSRLSIPVMVEVASADQAVVAANAGASAVVARGNEGPGWVSETNGMVLLQEILRKTDIPVYLQGGIDFRTAAGALAAGASGVVLDVHLLLTSESGLDSALQTFLRTLSMPATSLLAEIIGSPLRVYSRVGTKIVRELKRLEDSLTPDDFATYRERLDSALKAPVSAPDSGGGLLPLSEDIVTAKKFAEQFGSAEAVLKEFDKRLFQIFLDWPFTGESAICKGHGTEFPIVQGPMAHVSDNPDFLAAVAAGGALPFMAMGNMPEPI